MLSVQGAGEEDQVLLRRISHPREGKPDEFNEHYVPDSSHNGNWVVEVVCEHVRFLLILHLVPFWGHWLET